MSRRASRPLALAGGKVTWTSECQRGGIDAESPSWRARRDVPPGRSPSHLPRWDGDDDLPFTAGRAGVHERNVPSERVRQTRGDLGHISALRGLNGPLGRGTPQPIAHTSTCSAAHDANVRRLSGALPISRRGFDARRARCLRMISPTRVEGDLPSRSPCAGLLVSGNPAESDLLRLRSRTADQLMRYRAAAR